MMPKSRVVCMAVLTWLIGLGGLQADDKRPVSGDQVKGFEPLDKAMLDFMERIGCSAGTIAVSKDGKILYSRGFGWSDERKKTPVRPDALMRIASISKPLTAAAIKEAIKDEKVTLDAKAFELVAVKPPNGAKVDPRLAKITVRHLLEHKGGWDRDAAKLDPSFRVKDIQKALKLKAAVTPDNVVQYMLSQPLQFEPGEKSVYSNFGYTVLGRVLEKTYDKPYADCVKLTVLDRVDTSDIKLGSSSSKRRDAREVWYPVADNEFSLDVMDAHGGWIASAPALCDFLAKYWITGDRREAGQRGNWLYSGSLTGTTAMVRQREDGVNWAVLFNGRREKSINEDNDALRDNMDKAIGRSLEQK